MYLDKPMRDHVLLQAIARVNRPHESEGKRKPGGFVVDFVGIFEKLEKALAFDSADVQAVVEGLDILESRFRDLMERGRKEYLPIIASRSGESADKAAEAALSHFRDDETRQHYYHFYRELEDLYEIISPSAFLREFLDDYNALAGLYDLLRAAFEGIRITDRELARKTAELVQQHTQGGIIREALHVYGINERTLDEIAKENQPDTVKVFNLLKSLEQEVVREIERAPYLLSIGERAERIAEEFKLHQASAEQALKKLEDLVNEINAARQEQANRDIPTEAFTIYWLLKQDGAVPEAAENAARSMKAVFAEYPHWRTSEAQSRDVRRKLYLVLVEAGVTDVSVGVERIMAVITRESAR
jgi:type I restriction enzyme, R subunit